MRDAHVLLAGGRRLAYTDIGAAGDRCLFYFHGAPMSRLHLLPLEEQFAAQGLRVVSPDRPGYGRSSPQPGRSLLDWPADVGALADALGIDRFLVAAHSSGGPYALACAALLRERVLGAAVLAGVTDMAWPGAWDGYIESESQLMRLPGEGAVLASCVERFGADGLGLLAKSDFVMSEADNALLADPKAGAALMRALTEAFRQGVGGYAQDVFIQGRPWPFDPGSITVPVRVVHGDADAVVPLSHGRHTAELIPGSSFRVLAGHGHLTIPSMLPSLAAALAGLQRASGN